MSRLRMLRTVCSVFCGLAFCSSAVANDGLRLDDVSQDAGIQFKHSDGSFGKYYLVEAVSSGLASFDFDLDGRVDIYFLNGTALPGATNDYPTDGNALYRNLGGFQFADVSPHSRLDDTRFGLGVTVGDVNNDGFPDVYVSNLGPNVLYVNQGDGTFQPAANAAVLACGDKAGAGCNMLDLDGDGDLDIFAASYMVFDPSIEASVFRGRTVYGGPLLYPKAADNLLQNDGADGYVDVSQRSGIAEAEEWGMGSICLDYDSDGDTDIFVANDSTRNLLFENDGGGVFLESALLGGVAYDHRGDPQGSMGVDAADFNADGRLDLVQTAYTKQLATLYQNLDGGFFEDATLKTGAGANTFYAVNWGVAFVDIDNDGDKDIYLANGHIHDNLDDLDDTVQYKIPNQLLINQNGRRFAEATQVAGTGLAISESSRGIVAEDFDLDGRVDLVVLNSRTEPSVIRNASSAGNWVLLDLVGVQSNRDAVGSRVEVVADGKTQVLEVHSGRGYQSHFGSRLHFGLGDVDSIDVLRVHWHAGKVEQFEDLPTDTHFVVRQGLGIQRMEISP